MFNIFKKVDSNSLEAALRTCQAANKQGYTEALVYLNELHESIYQTTEIISDCIDGNDKFHVLYRMYKYNAA
jgi:hypothetical protein